MRLLHEALPVQSEDRPEVGSGAGRERLRQQVEVRQRAADLDRVAVDGAHRCERRFARLARGPELVAGEVVGEPLVEPRWKRGPEAPAVEDVRELVPQHGGESRALGALAGVDHDQAPTHVAAAGEAADALGSPLEDAISLFAAIEDDGLGRLAGKVELVARSVDRLDLLDHLRQCVELRPIVDVGQELIGTEPQLARRRLEQRARLVEARGIGGASRQRNRGDRITAERRRRRGGHRRQPERADAASERSPRRDARQYRGTLGSTSMLH